MDEDFIYSLSYNQILSFSEPERSILLNSFNEISSYINENIFSCDKSLGDMLIESSMFIDDSISDYTFPGEKALYYPNINIVKAHKNYICAVSGDVLKIGSEIICWKPFFWLPNLKEAYVLSKTIKCSLYYGSFLPTCIKSFDSFYFKLEHSYELDLEDYYNFYANIQGAFNIRKLKR